MFTTLLPRPAVRRSVTLAALAALLACGGSNEPSGNPVPTLTSLSRDTATSGIPAFFITLRGSGFMTGAVGTVDGNIRQTNVLTDSTATLVVLPADVSTTGARQVRLENPDPTDGPSAPRTLTVLAAPVPVLDSISPDTVVSGGPTFTLHAYGSGYTPSSVIRWNSIPLTTTQVDPTHLTTSIPSSAILGAGTMGITVFTAAPGGGTSTSRELKVMN
jgi:hypothetical protein